MSKQFSTTLWFSLAVLIILVQPGYSKNHSIARNTPNYCGKIMQASDSATARAEVMNVINAVIKASGTFDLSSVANLYTPNAVIADEEPPFSWNGPTAGVQWVSVVEKTCKEYKLRDFKGKIGRINVYLQTDESIYVVVPVNYTGQIRGESFEEEGAFTFVFRQVSGQWLIKSQVWVARKGL